jgi:hypothetical protein
VLLKFDCGVSGVERGQVGMGQQPMDGVERIYAHGDGNPNSY